MLKTLCFQHLISYRVKSMWVWICKSLLFIMQWDSH